MKQCKHPCCGEVCRKPRKGLQRTPIKKKPYKISKTSDKRKDELKEYKEKRALFMKQHPTCEAVLPNCQKKSKDVHHKKGRGKYMNDVATWIAVCRRCHDWITENSKEAIEMGLSERRII